MLVELYRSYLYDNEIKKAEIDISCLLAWGVFTFANIIYCEWPNKISLEESHQQMNGLESEVQE